MNRRTARFLILGVSSLLVVGLFAGREMASWRPQRLAPLFAKAPGTTADIHASNHSITYVEETDRNQNDVIVTRYDLLNGKQTTSKFHDQTVVGVQNNFLWSADLESSALKVVDEQGRATSFPLEASTPEAESSNIRILPEQNKVLVIDSIGISEWNLRTGKLQEQLDVDARPKGDEYDSFALSRDGRKFFRANKTSFIQGDTSSGKITKTTRLQGIRFHENLVLSSYGRYAFYDQPGAPFRWEVVSTQTGKRLWGFNIPPIVSPLWAVSDDETTIVVPADKEWVVRDLQTGAVLRRLPFVPGVTIAALSPDGATLYSVANGVLYRQRALK